MNTDTKEDTSKSKPATAGEEKKPMTAEAEPAAEAIEEDDEFDEFEPCQWAAHDEDAEDALQWQDNWDDDDIEDDFTNHLRAELTRNTGK